MKLALIDLDGTLGAPFAPIPAPLDVVSALHQPLLTLRLDPLNERCKTLINGLFKLSLEIVIISHRSEMYRPGIEAWLRDHLIPWDMLCLRPSGDRRSERDIKKEILYTRIRKEDVLFVVEHKEELTSLWEDEGLLCLQLAHHSYVGDRSEVSAG